MKTKLKLYNTLTRKKEEFKSITKGKARMYVCGPTIYDYVHIGNLRAYTIADILRRILAYNGFKVKEVMNLTDVDDKTIKRSQEQGVSLSQLTGRYEKAFLEDIKALNINKPDVMPKATLHIKEMVALIKILLKKGYAYKTEDGIYFSIKKFKDYGKLARIKPGKLKQTERMRKDSYEKEEVRDFALWKFYSKEDGNIFWETGIGKGRPGWHIECSAMSTKYLGEYFDIHAGGIDLIFPHHQNEIAQSEAATGKKFVNFWIHNEWLFVDGKKMSKSLGNFYTLRDVIARKFNPLVLKYFYLTVQYRAHLDFTWKNLENAQNSYERLKNIIGELKDDGKENKKYLEEFEKAVNNDLDMPGALKVLWEMVRDEKAYGKLKTIEKMDKVFGLDLLKKEKILIPEQIRKLVEEREKFRKLGEWKKADELREKIKKLGYWINDTEEGAKIRKILI